MYPQDPTENSHRPPPVAHAILSKTAIRTVLLTVGAGTAAWPISPTPRRFLGGCVFGAAMGLANLWLLTRWSRLVTDPRRPATVAWGLHLFPSIRMLLPMVLLYLSLMVFQLSPVGVASGFTCFVVAMLLTGFGHVRPRRLQRAQPPLSIHDRDGTKNTSGGANGPPS